MYEYKVVGTSTSEAEKEMNRLAQEGWRVVATCVSGQWITITFEREKKEN